MKDLTNAQISAGLLSIARSIGPKCSDDLKRAIVAAAPLQTDREALIAAVQSAERCARAAEAGSYVDMNLLAAEMHAALWVAGADTAPGPAHSVINPSQASDLPVTFAYAVGEGRRVVLISDDVIEGERVLCIAFDPAVLPSVTSAPTDCAAIGKQGGEL